MAGRLRFFADGSSTLALAGTLVDGSRVAWNLGSAEPLTDGADLVFTGALPLGRDGRAQAQPTRIRLTADLSAGPAGPITSNEENRP